MDRTVDQDGLVGVDRIAVLVDRREEFVELAAAQIGFEPAIVERRITGQRDDLTVLVVLDHDRPGRRLVRNLARVLGEHEFREVRLGVERVDRHLLPAESELGLECLLGELLLVEVDRQLHVVAVDRRHSAYLAHDPAGIVDLVGDVAPLAVQLLFHAQFDPELPDALVEVVAVALIEVLRLGRDASQVADHMAGQRRVGIDPPRLFEDLDARKVLDAFLEGDGGALVDVLGHGHRQERAVHLAVEPGLHLLDGHVDPPRQATEDLRAVVAVANHFPIDADGEDPVVVREDPTLGVEDATALGQQRNRAQFRRVDLGLQRLLLDGLQEPQTRTDEAEQQHADEREHAKAGSSLVSGHVAAAPCSTSGSS